MYGKLLAVGAGIAIGFVLGARQGRPAYDRIVERVRGIRRDPDVRKVVGTAQDTLRDKVPVVGDAVADALDPPA
jgi:hypothetical protein